MKRCALLSCLVIVGLASTACADPSVNIHYVANEGFLFEIGSKKILIDALFDDPSISYCHIPEKSTLHKMESAQPPFDGLDLILVTHAHRDHFSAGAMLRRLKHDSSSVILAPPQAVEALRLAAPESESITSRVREIDIELLSSVELEIAGIGVQVFRLPHSRYMVTDENGEQYNRHETVENLVYLIDVEGVQIIHVGDAVLSQVPGLFEDGRFPKSDLDFAFLEYFDWSPETRTILDEWMQPDHIVFMHLPPDREQIDRIRQKLVADFPEAILFGEQLESRKF